MFCTPLAGARRSALFLPSPTGLAARTACALAFLALFAAPVSAAESITILPAEITLRGPEARHQVVVEITRDGKFYGPVEGQVTFTSSNPKVAKVEEGVVLPVGNGKVTITATTNGKSAKAAVTVTEMDKPFHWSFRNHVQPVLTKAGCNMGACHGAAHGKKGFKLSLRGYDAENDYYTLTRESRGRRIVPGDPGRSMILTKPTGALPHGGGLRFDVDSREYRVIADWIADGMTPPSDDDRRIRHLEILPKNAILKKGGEQQFLVLAHFKDGTIEDVTRWAKYNSASGDVATVEKNGTVNIIGFGEGAITVWYLSKVVIGSVTVPYENDVPPEVFAQADKRNFIDELVLDKQQSLALPPSPQCSDAEFLRRAYLDCTGTLPTLEETNAFLADKSPDKRDKLIEKLLDSPEFIDYWAYKWSDLLLVNSANLKPPAMWAYYNWIRNQVAANTPWDKLAQKVVTATGSTLENGAANYFVLHKDPQELTETTSQAFLGMSINCARCHDHPLEKWTNDEYYAMANLFARVRTKDAQGDGNFAVYSIERGELLQPGAGKPQPPTPLDGDSIPFDDPGDRRKHLAEWLTSPENPYFARAITNRVWANFLGVGLVEKVDDLRLTNPPSNEALLNRLADYLVKHKYDLKTLMRLIMQSATYQRSSIPLAGNKGDTRFYSRYYPRRLMAEVALDAASQVTAAPTKFPGYPDNWRALKLPDSNVRSYFLETFGRPDREITCACERGDETSMVHAMHLFNGDTLNKKLQRKGNRVDELLKKQPAELIDEAYLRAVCRRPTEKEKQQLLEVFQKTPQKERRALVEDFLWSLLTSKEFLFNH